MDLVVCPFATGTGIKIKILEAMAHGKVVITNELGAMGIDAEPHRQIIVENDEHRMADVIYQFANNRASLRPIEIAAREFVGDRYSSRAILASIRQALEASFEARLS